MQKAFISYAETSLFNWCRLLHRTNCLFFKHILALLTTNDFIWFSPWFFFIRFAIYILLPGFMCMCMYSNRRKWFYLERWSISFWYSCRLRFDWILIKSNPPPFYRSRYIHTSVEHFTLDIPGHIPPYLLTVSLSPWPLPPTIKANVWLLALIRTPDPNRSTSINFVHVNGTSLYIVDRRMVAVEGEVSYTM